MQPGTSPTWEQNGEPDLHEKRTGSVSVKPVRMIIYSDYLLKSFPKFMIPKSRLITEEHDAAMINGVTGVTAICMEGLPSALIGLQEQAVYIRLVEMALAD